MSDFTLVALHTTPKQTVQELEALIQVVEDIHKMWGTPNILILGDLNADCNYVPKKAWPRIRLRHDSHFWWPIGDDVDTTVNSNTNCAYDRCVLGCMCVCVSSMEIIVLSWHVFCVGMCWHACTII